MTDFLISYWDFVQIYLWQIFLLVPIVVTKGSGSCPLYLFFWGSTYGWDQRSERIQESYNPLCRIPVRRFETVSIIRGESVMEIVIPFS